MNLTPSITLGTYYVLGGIYVALFLLFAVKKPKIALCLSFGLAPIQRALPGLPAKMTLADFNLALTFAVFVLQHVCRGQRIRWGPLAIPAIIYLGICGISSLPDWHGETTAVAYLQMIPYFMFSVILFSSYGTADDLKPGFYLLIAVGLFLSVSAIAAVSPYVYGMNKNGMGASLSCITIVIVELWLGATDARKKRIYLVCLVIHVAALLITLSRGSWMATLVGIMLILALRGDFKALSRVAMLLVPLVAAIWIVLPSDDKKAATDFDLKNDNISRRIDFLNEAWATFQKNPLLGSGVGLRKNMDATNVVMMSLAESGLLGFAAFALIHVVILKTAWKARTTLNHSSWAFSCLAIGAALVISKLVHGMVDHYWSRGSLSLAWAGAGMVTRAFYESRKVARPRVISEAIPQIPVPRRRRPRPRGRPGTWPGPITEPPQF